MSVGSRDPGMPTILDTITSVDGTNRGEVVVAGSHGGAYPGQLALEAGVRGVILNDAGVGMDEAGIASLGMLAEQGVPAAAVDHRSARIGDGEDMYRRGTISHVNDVASTLGCEPGQSAEHCAALMASADPVETTVPDRKGGRHLLRDGAPRVWGLDSVSMLRESDEGEVVVSGSHGSRLPGEDEKGSYVFVDPAGITFNDAGRGADGAGTTRLPHLAERDVPAATVDCRTARIGDARSAWETGELSVVNEAAADLGVEPGDSCRSFVETLL